jgi:hypothetical protein
LSPPSLALKLAVLCAVSQTRTKKLKSFFTRD